MTRCLSGARDICLSASRSARVIASTITIAIAASACQNDAVTSSYDECAGQPGCQAESAPVSLEVIQSLDDANSRVLSVLKPTVRTSIEGHIAKLKTALVQRDIDGGRIAFAAAINAIAVAERANSESGPDLGVIRLELVPAARSLGLPMNSVDVVVP